MLEEMPPFPERESSILAKLKKKKRNASVNVGAEKEEKTPPPEKPKMNGQIPVAIEPQVLNREKF